MKTVVMLLLIAASTCAIALAADSVVPAAGTGDTLTEQGFVPYELAPQPMADSCSQPSFPALAKKVGVQSGKVIVQVFVDKHGVVRKWQVRKCNPQGMGFDTEVEKVIPHWRFTPAVQQGQPIGVWIAIPFRFDVDHSTRSLGGPPTKDESVPQAPSDSDSSNIALPYK